MTVTLAVRVERRAAKSWFHKNLRGKVCAGFRCDAGRFARPWQSERLTVLSGKGGSRDVDGLSVVDGRAQHPFRTVGEKVVEGWR